MGIDLQSPASSGTVVAEEGGFGAVLARVGRVLGKAVNVLIVGESGTGKELVARSIHHGDQRRRQQAFVPVNCAAMPEPLLEAELFGYRKGSFTGAATDREGAFARAAGGTLFLDEIGELSPQMQPKLLRVLQERAIRPVGSSAESPIDVRVVASTNLDLESAIADGSFRLDLYFRLADFVISVPPLRQRRHEVAPLAEHFFALYRSEFDRHHIVGLSAPAISWLRRRDWSLNNVRELSVALKGAVLLCDGPLVEVCHLEEVTASMPGAEHSVEVELERLRDILMRTEGNISAAARMLGMKRSTLFDRLTKLGLRN